MASAAATLQPPSIGLYVRCDVPQRLRMPCSSGVQRRTMRGSGLCATAELRRTHASARTVGALLPGVARHSVAAAAHTCCGGAEAPFTSSAMRALVTSRRCVCAAAAAGASSRAGDDDVTDGQVVSSIELSQRLLMLQRWG
eukprot:355984-Chlamydomonas_euryale.AAC.3